MFRYTTGVRCVYSTVKLVRELMHYPRLSKPYNSQGLNCTVSEACRGDNPLLFFVPGYDQPELPAEGRKKKPD